MNKEKILAEFVRETENRNRATTTVYEVLKQILNSQESEDKYQVATEVYGEYAEQMAKEYDSTPYPEPFQNWLARQEGE